MTSSGIRHGRKELLKPEFVEIVYYAVRVNDRRTFRLGLLSTTLEACHQFVELRKLRRQQIK